MSCPVCGKPSVDTFCSAHEMAYQNILEAYDVWRRAMDVSWREYLERARSNPNSGRWAQEVCAHLLQSGVKGNTDTETV